FERMERTAEPGLRVGHDRGEPVRVVLPGHVLLLVFPTEGVVDPPHYVRDAVGRIETQIGIHVARVVSVRRDLPSAQVDRAKSRPDLLDRLVAGEGTEGRDVPLSVKELPQPFRPELREGMPDPYRTAQPVDVRGAVGPHDPGPPIRGLPILFQSRDL